MLAVSINDKFMSSTNSPAKRTFQVSIFEDEDLDSENIDPSLAGSKRSKGIDGTPIKQTRPSFNLVTDGTAHTSNNYSPPTPALSNMNMPTSPLGEKHKVAAPPFTYPSGASSAPAGRSPKHKRIGILSKNRTSLSSYKGINPPSFGMSKSRSTSSLLFSIDAALSGTISSYTPSTNTSVKPMASILEQSQPKGWFFEIHEDTPDEEAGIIMEHSTCILDISSDDEEGLSRKKDGRGKENIPPPDYATPSMAGNAHNQASSVVTKLRESIGIDAMADVAEARAPLGSLPAEDFYARGLDAGSIEMVAPEVEAGSEDEAPQAQDENAFEHHEKHANKKVRLNPGSDLEYCSPEIVIFTDEEPCA